MIPSLFQALFYHSVIVCNTCCINYNLSYTAKVALYYFIWCLYHIVMEILAHFEKMPAWEPQLSFCGIAQLVRFDPQ